MSHIVDFAFPTPVFVVRASPELLIAFQTFRSAEVQLRSAIGAEHQAGKQAFSPCCGGSALVLPQLLYPLPQRIRDDSFLRIGNDLPFLLRPVDRLVYLVADGSGLEIHRTACVLAVG